MSEIIIKNAVNRTNKDKLKYNYRIDKEGNLIKEKYSIFTDPYTLVTICVILMGILYYTSIVNSPYTVDNLDNTCNNLVDICGRYFTLKDMWGVQNPNATADVRAIIGQTIYCNNNQDYKINFTISNG